MEAFLQEAGGFWRSCVRHLGQEGFRNGDAGDHRAGSISGQAI